MSQHSFSSEIQDFNTTSSCHNLRVSIPDSESSEEDDESIDNVTAGTPVSEGFVDGEGESEDSHNCEPTAS